MGAVRGGSPRCDTELFVGLEVGLEGEYNILFHSAVSVIDYGIYPDFKSK